MKGKITISRLSYGDDRERIEITIRDDASRVNFVTADLSYEDFTKALTGMNETPCNLKIDCLRFVGKSKETKSFEFEIPGCDYDIGRDKTEEIGLSKCPKNWVMNKYFNSKNSFFEKDGKQYARTSIYRYV